MNISKRAPPHCNLLVYPVFFFSKKPNHPNFGLEVEGKIGREFHNMIFHKKSIKAEQTCTKHLIVDYEIRKRRV